MPIRSRTRKKSSSYGKFANHELGTSPSSKHAKLVYKNERQNWIFTWQYIDKTKAIKESIYSTLDEQLDKGIKEYSQTHD